MQLKKEGRALDVVEDEAHYSIVSTSIVAPGAALQLGASVKCSPPHRIMAFN
jgi:hypothetical protein